MGRSKKRSRGGRPKWNDPGTKLSPLCNCIVKNYAILDLGESNAQLRLQYRECIQGYRHWVFRTTNKHYMLDHKKGPLSMAPENGNFFIYTKHGTRWMCSVIDGVTGYLDGHITVSTGNIDQDLRVRENNLDKNQYIEHSSRLNWSGRYTESASEAHVGAHALRWAFDKLYVHVTAVSSTPEGKRVCDDVPRAGEIFVLHFAEAARFDSLFLDVIDKKFETNESIGVGPQAIRKARRWSSDCKYATKLLDCGSSTEEDKRKAHDKLKDIRLIHRPSPNHGYFLLKDMPIQLTADGAVLPADENAARDDPNMIASCPYLKAKNQLIQATTIEEEAQYDISLSLPLHTGL